MALINCPECGKEFSDKASTCPNCGCPTETFIKRSEFQGQPDTFNCPSCGRPIPTDSVECLYCNHRFILESTKQKICCPECGSVNIDISVAPSMAITGFQSLRIPFFMVNKKISVCKSCGHSWNVVSKKESERFRLIVFIIFVLIMFWFYY